MIISGQHHDSVIAVLAATSSALLHQDATQRPLNAHVEDLSTRLPVSVNHKIFLYAVTDVAPRHSLEPKLALIIQGSRVAACRSHASADATMIGYVNWRACRLRLPDGGLV
jgi:hypothetical protein